MNPSFYEKYECQCYPRDMEIPSEYQHCRFSNFKAQGFSDRIEPLVQAVESTGWGVLLGKRTGNGKSHLGVSSLIRSWASDRFAPEYGIERNPQCSKYRFYNARRLGVNLETAGLDFTEMLDEVLNHRGILLDEFGRAMSDKARDRLEILIDECHSQRVQLIITAGMNPQEFNQCLDGSILRRINDHAVFVHCDWTRQG